MKINFLTEINSPYGQPIRNMKGQPFALLDAATIALDGIFQDEMIGGEEKRKRWKLAEKIYGAKDGVADLSVEEIALIKTLIGKMFSPRIVAAAWDILDPASPKT